MDNITPSLNLPQRKVKGLVKLFQGISAPFYYTASIVAEGTPMVPLLVKDKIRPATPGATEGAKVIGLSLQITYDDSTYGQLRNYHFANDTRQRLDGSPIGLLMGTGWAMTNNYTGNVNYGDQAAVGASGKLVVSNISGDNLPVIFESAGTNGTTMVRIRYHFPAAVVPLAN